MAGTYSICLAYYWNWFIIDVIKQEVFLSDVSGYL